MEQELVELDAGLAFNDRDDPLMVLNRRESRDLHLVGEANEDAPLLRLGDELVHRAGANVAVLRNIEPPDVAPGADRLEDRMRTRDGLTHRLVRRRGLVRAGSNAANRLAVPLLAAAALTPLPTALRGGARSTGTTAPAHRTALTLRLTTLVTCELARLLALFTRGELLRTKRRCPELRARRAELRTWPGVGRTRCAEAGPAAASAPAAAPPAARAVLIARLRGRRRSRLARPGCRAWAGVACGLARGLVPALPCRLVVGAL